MKHKILIAGLFALATILVSSCAKEQFFDNNDKDYEPEHKSGQVVSLFATTQQVKTVNDGVNTYWSEADAISVFHAPTGTTEYSANSSFVINSECLDPTKDNYGCFEGPITEELSESNDWYALYPYKETIPSPAGTSVAVNASIVFGSDANVAQVQQGNNNTAHLAGTNMPLYGKTLNVASGNTPSVTMNQAAAVVKIVVTNANAEPLTVQSVQFTANENIAGMFAMDITGDQPVYYDCGTASHVSKTAKLSVVEGAELEQGASASFYLAIKPFVAEKGSKLKVTVNGYEKELQMPEGNDVTFTAGKFKKVSFNYNPAEPKEYELVTSLDGITDGEYVIVNGDYLLPNTEVTAGNGPAALALEGNATIEGNVLKTISEAIVWKFVGTNAAMAVKSYADENDYLYASSSTSNTGLRIASAGNGQTWEFAVNGEGFSMTNNGRFCAKYKDGSDWRSYNTANAANYADGGQLKLYMRASTDPAIKANDVTGVPATGGEQQTTYEIKNIDTDDVTATCDGTVVTSATASEGTVTFNVAPNYTLEDVTTGTITLTSASTGATATVGVSQDASVFEVTAPDEIALANTELAEGTFIIKSTFAGTISIDDKTNFTVDDTYAANEGGQEYTVLANGAGDPTQDRMAIITITREGLDDVTIPVRQYKSGNMPLAAPENLTVTKHNANDGVSVTWACNDNNVTSYDWIISTENTAAAAEDDVNAVKGNATEQNFNSPASKFKTNTTYYLYVRSAAKEGYDPSVYVTENFTIDPKQDNAFDFSAQGYENGESVTSVDLDDNINVAFEGGKYYNTGAAIRVYGGKTFTVSQIATKAVVNELIIKKIEISFSTGEDSNTITADSGTYSNGIWTGEASSVKFTVGGTSGHRRIKAISVEYTGGIPPVFVESVSLDNTELELSEGESATLVATVLPDNAKNKNVTWSSSAEGVATVDQEGKVVAVAKGEATITVTTEDGGKTATCAVTVKEAHKYAITIADSITGGTVESSHEQAAAGTEITLTATSADKHFFKGWIVTNASTSEAITVTDNKFTMPAAAVYVSAEFEGTVHAGTEEDPFSVSDLNLVASYLAADATVFGKGKISEVEEVNTSYGNATYTIADLEDASKTFYVYRGKYVGNVNFTSKSQIGVGDEVVITGKVTSYQDAYQFAQNNHIVSINKAPYLTVTPTEISVSAAATTATINVDTNIEGWTVESSDNTNFACSTVDKTVTVTITENQSDNDREATITVKSNKDGVADVVVTIKQAKKAGQAQDGDVLWAETFAGFSANDVPTKSNASTTVYGGGSVTYDCVNGGSNTKIYNETLAGGTAPEILVGKTSGSFEASGIPAGGITSMTLTFRSNKTTISVTSTTATVSGIALVSSTLYKCTVTVPANTSTLDLKWAATSSDNVRVDDIKLVAGAAKVDPTITPVAKTITLSGTPASATQDLDQMFSSTSDGAFTYSLKASSTTASIEGSTFTATAKGTYTIVATQAATDTYNAGSAEATITVNEAGQGGGTTKTLIIDGSKLTSTATTAATDYTYGDFTITMSDGAKAQSSSGDNKFTDSAILIGKSGKYIYNKTPIPGKITKFEIYANKGASAKVSVGVLFSTTAISTYATGTNTYTATLSTLDNVYDCSSKIPDGAKYFWYQVTNANNSQVQFRITYTTE